LFYARATAGDNIEVAAVHKIGTIDRVMLASSNDALHEAESLIAHLQAATESEKTALARELHDNLGGLMMAALMDLGSLKQLLPEISRPAQERLDRVTRTLQTAVDFKRRVIEELRPSILDNFGLFAALRWQLKKTGQRSDAVCTEDYPAIEPYFEPRASIALFRIAQEALAMTLDHESVTSTSLHVQVANGTVWMSLSYDGIPVMSDGHEDCTANALAAMRHRIRLLGGTVDIERTEAGDTVLTTSMPLSTPPLS
jgi:signal transduction histidine kinase